MVGGMGGGSVYDCGGVWWIQGVGGVVRGVGRRMLSTEGRASAVVYGEKSVGY